MNRKHNLLIASAITLVLNIFAPVFVGVAHAAPPPQFSQAYVRLDRHKTLTDTGAEICVTPSLSDNASFVDVTFPTQSTGTDFVVSSTAAHWTVNTNNLPSGATAWPGITTATTVTGKTVRFPSTALTAATQYCFNIDAGTGAADRTLENGSPGYLGLSGSVTTYDSSGTTINEQTNWATSVIADDQVVVSAVVPPAFNFTISGNTDAFTSNLDPASIISTSGVTFSIVTNAKGGWISWVKSTGALYSATANYHIYSVTPGSNPQLAHQLTANSATEDYVLAASIVTDAANGCVVGLDPEYDPGVATDKGGTLSTNFQTLASCTGTPPATSNGDTVGVEERATIAGGTPAGSDYSDVLTIVAAGNF